MQSVDPSKPMYFYDDRNKYDYMFKAVGEVLYRDDEIAIIMAQSTDLEYNLTEKLIFNLKDGTVVNSDYYSWYATNDLDWAIPEDERIRQRGADIIKSMKENT